MSNVPPEHKCLKHHVLCVFIPTPGVMYPSIIVCWGGVHQSIYPMLSHTYVESFTVLQRKARSEISFFNLHIILSSLTVWSLVAGNHYLMQPKVAGGREWVKLCWYFSVTHTRTTQKPKFTQTYRKVHANSSLLLLYVNSNSYLKRKQHTGVRTALGQSRAASGVWLKGPGCFIVLYIFWV